MKNFLYIAIFATASLAQGNVLKSEGASELVDARDELGAISTYISGREQRLMMRGKDFDIFGRPQDPRRAQQANQAGKVAAVKQKVELPLQQIVDALPVTMIDTLGDRVVMSGAPPFKVGQTLELNYQGEKVVLIFEGARSNGAYFREQKSKKLKIHKMTRLAKGITKGNKETFIAGGIQKEGSNQPQKINLDMNMSRGPGGPGPN